MGRILRLLALAAALLNPSALAAQQVFPVLSQPALLALINGAQTVSPVTGVVGQLVTDTSWAPAGGTGVQIGLLARQTITGSGTLTGGGHIVGGLNYLVNNNTNAALPLLSPIEARLDNSGGGGITNAVLNIANLATSNGPITTAVMYNVQVTNLTAATTTLYGLLFPAIAGTGGNTVTPGTMYALANLEPAAFIYNTGPYLSPANTVTAKGLLSSADVPTISACGTSPPAADAGSSRNAGKFTFGTGTPTACTVTFATAFPTNAYCTVTPLTALGVVTYSISAQSKSAFTVTLSVGTSSAAFNYTCGGN